MIHLTGSLIVIRQIKNGVASRLCCGGLFLSLAAAGCADTEAPMVVRHRAMLAEQRGDWETALKTREQFLEKFTDYPFRGEVYFEQGMTHLDQGNLEESEKFFSKAIEEDDRFLRAYARRCQVNSMLGKHQDAILDGNRAVELSVSDRDLADVFLHQANSEAELERYERAIVKWRMALVLNPEQLDALGRLFRAHMIREENEDALELIENSLDLNDRVAVKHAYYSEILARLGRTEEAEAELKRAHELNVGDEVPLPESVDQFPAVQTAQTFEEAPMVRTAAKPAFTEVPTGDVETAPPAVEEKPASSSKEKATSIALQFLTEQGLEVNPVEGNELMLHCLGNGEEFEVLIKAVADPDPRQFEISQEDLTTIAAKSPPRGMLLVSVPESTEENDQPAGRVAAFTKSWRPDPFRLTPELYRYQLPAPPEEATPEQ